MQIYLIELKDFIEEVERAYKCSRLVTLEMPVMKYLKRKLITKINIMGWNRF